MNGRSFASADSFSKLDYNYDDANLSAYDGDGREDGDVIDVDEEDDNYNCCIDDDPADMLGDYRGDEDEDEERRMEYDANTSYTRDDEYDGNDNDEEADNDDAAGGDALFDMHKDTRAGSRWGSGSINGNGSSSSSYGSSGGYLDTLDAGHNAPFNGRGSGGGGSYSMDNHNGTGVPVDGDDDVDEDDESDDFSDFESLIVARNRQQ